MLSIRNISGTISNPKKNGSLFAMASKKQCKKTRDLFAYADDNRPSIVYMATNSVNGKRYIGITRQDLRKRKIQQYGNSYAIKLEPTDMNDFGLIVGDVVDIDDLVLLEVVNKRRKVKNGRTD